jgi:hypothetical protein
LTAIFDKTNFSKPSLCEISNEGHTMLPNLSVGGRVRWKQRRENKRHRTRLTWRMLPAVKEREVLTTVISVLAAKLRKERAATPAASMPAWDAASMEAMSRLPVAPPPWVAAAVVGEEPFSGREGRSLEEWIGRSESSALVVTGTAGFDFLGAAAVTGDEVNSAEGADEDGVLCCGAGEGRETAGLSLVGFPFPSTLLFKLTGLAAEIVEEVP